MSTKPGNRLALWLAAYSLLICLAIALSAKLTFDALRHPPEPETVPAFSQGDIFAIFSPTPSASPSSSPVPPPEFSVVAVAPTIPSNPTFEVEVISPESPKKRVLIYHTHTYEAYAQDESDKYKETEKWRTADNRYNVVRVGNELRALLNAHGIDVVHDETAFEPPSLSSSYARSLSMLESRIESGEEYDLYIDLHRDAYSSGGISGNCVVIGDTRVAQVMLLVGKGEGQTTQGFETSSEWERNLDIANAITASLNAQKDGLCRDVRVKSGRFNQHIAPRCVLLEVGNNRNTLSEALAAMPYLADAIDAYLSAE